MANTVCQLEQFQEKCEAVFPEKAHSVFPWEVRQKKGERRFRETMNRFYRVRHAAAEAAISMSNAATVAQVAKPKLE